MRRALTLSVAVLALLTGTAACGRSAGTAAVPHTPPAASTPPAAVPTATPTPAPSPTGPTAFTSSISTPTAADLGKSWHSGCPVPPAKLRVLTMTYWGMDGQPHTGQLVVNASVTDTVTGIFRTLYAKRFPIRGMQPVSVYGASDYASIDADNTSSFNCRNATGASSWSEHAYGLAIDIDPCENPYVYSDGSVAHPKCVKYGDRSRTDPGLIHKGDLVYDAFISAGWGWGGEWSGDRDYQHFSINGR